MFARKLLLTAIVAMFGIAGGTSASAESVHYVFRVPIKGVAAPANPSSTVAPPNGAQYEWLDRSEACPPGEEGSNTWQEVFETTPSYRPTGQIRNHENTCMVPLGIPVLSGPSSAYPGAGYSVSWNAVPVATRYELHLNDGGAEGTVYNGPNTTALRVASMTVGQVDHLTARACDATRCGDWSVPLVVTVTNPAAPSAPTLAAPATVIAGGAINVSWSSVSSPGGYPLYYVLKGHKDGASDATFYSGGGLAASLPNATPIGATYHFSLQACDTFNCSAISSANTVVNPPIPAVPSLTVPSTANAGGAGYPSTWTAASGASYYEEYELAPGIDGLVYKGSATSWWRASTPTVGDVHKLKVRACNVSGCSDWSAEQTVTMANPPAPAAPTISAPSTVIAGGSVAVSWGTSSSPGGYPLHYELVNNKDGSAAAQVYSGAATSATGVSDASPAGSTYGFGIRACDTYNCSSYAWTSTLVQAPIPATPTPSAPANVWPGQGFAVSWNSVGGATRYDLYQWDNVTKDTVYSGAGTSFARVANGTVGFVHQFQVRSCNATGCSGWSAPISVTVVNPAAPATPSVLNAPAAVIAGGSIPLSWSASSSPGGYALHYEVVYNTGPGNVWVYNGPGLSAAISNASPAGVTYYSYVRACDTYNCSGWKQANTVVNPATPSTPSGLYATPQVWPNGTVSVSWGGVSGATSYNLRVRYPGVDTVLTYGGTSTTGTAGAAGTVYTYNVQACNAAGCSGWSGDVTATVVQPPAPATPALTAPGGVSAGLPINISWSAVSGTTYYQLLGDAGTTASTLRYQGTSRSYSIPTAMNRRDSSYTVSVRACNASGCSGWRTHTVTIYGTG